jgi:hypothetical protein
MGQEGDEFDLLLSWALGEFIPDEDPPSRVWEAIEAKVALTALSEEASPLPWRSKARVWLGEALYLVRVALFLCFRPGEAGVLTERRFTPASGMISISAAPWPLFCFNSQIVIIGFETRSRVGI